MTDTEVKAVVEREQRTDRAERTLTLDGAPPFTYRYETFRTSGERSWRPTRARIEWDRGVLRRVVVTGLRLRKDGTESGYQEGVSFRITDGVVRPGRCQAYRAVEDYDVPEWLPVLVIQHAAAPAFKSLDQVGA